MKSGAVPFEKILWIKKAQGAAACGRIPENLEFFQDHFPAFPVLPGVLALDILKKTAEHCLQESVAGQGDQSLASVRNVKFSSYLKPGDAWESQVEMVSGACGEKTEWTGKLLQDGRPAVSARFMLEPVSAFHKAVS